HRSTPCERREKATSLLLRQGNRNSGTAKKYFGSIPELMQTCRSWVGGVHARHSGGTFRHEYRVVKKGPPPMSNERRQAVMAKEWREDTPYFSATAARPASRPNTALRVCPVNDG